jgi:hypothetical protein
MSAPVVTVPPWAAPTDQEVEAAHRAAYLRALPTQTKAELTLRDWRDRGRAATIQWAVAGGCCPIEGVDLGRLPTRDDAIHLLDATITHTGASDPTQGWADGVGEALAWLLGFASTPGLPVHPRI